MEGLDFEPITGVQMPKGHDAKDPKDFDKCPYSKMGAKLPQSGGNKQKADDKDSDSEDDAPKGGCPVMTNGNRPLKR